MAKLGPVGLWTVQGLWPTDPGELAATAAEVEQLGYASVWLGGPQGDDLAVADAILAATERLVVGTGIANIWTFDPTALAASHQRVNAARGGRFLLGIGVSHRPRVEGVLGLSYDQPMAKLGAFLDALDAAEPPVPKAERLLAALGPKALAVAAARTAGTVPYLTTPEHTAIARAAVGPDGLVIPEQKVVLETDAEVARGVARATLGRYFELPNYVRSWRRLGFSEDDVVADGSDRLVDGLVAWGDEATVAGRIRAHLDAGADQVAVQLLTTGTSRAFPIEALRAAAPVVQSFAR